MVTWPADLLRRDRELRGLSPGDVVTLLRSVGRRSNVHATTELQLAGRWWAAWQTWTQGEEIVATQRIEMDQHGITVRVRALERSEENVRGGYVWAGELCIWDNHVLMGWYAAEEPYVRSRGTFFFQVHTHGSFMEGRWTGITHDRPIVTGWAAIARARDESAAIVKRLKIERPRSGR